MNGGDPRDALYAALMRGDYSGITEDPSYPVEDPRQVSVPGGLVQMMMQQQSAMEPEMTLRGIDQGYGRQMPIGQQNGRGMMSSATQGGDAAIPQNTNEYKIDAPTFAAAFRKMAELGAPEGVNFVWYVNGKPQGLYKFAYAAGQSRPSASAEDNKFYQGQTFDETVITGQRPSGGSMAGGLQGRRDNVPKVYGTHAITGQPTRSFWEYGTLPIPNKP